MPRLSPESRVSPLVLTETTSPGGLVRRPPSRHVQHPAVSTLQSGSPYNAAFGAPVIEASLLALDGPRSRFSIDHSWRPYSHDEKGLPRGQREASGSVQSSVVPDDAWSGSRTTSGGWGRRPEGKEAACNNTASQLKVCVAGFICVERLPVTVL